MLTLVGRSSSHFTRIARIFASELGIPYAFEPVLDIMATEAAVFAGNPALRVPILREEGRPALYGSENICRRFVRHVATVERERQKIILRGDIDDPLVANIEELTLDVMASEVNLIFAKLTKANPNPKTVKSVDNCLHYLDAEIDTLLTKLPEGRRLSFVEVSLFCLITHLPFREVRDITPFTRLVAFRDQFEGERESARSTAYKFDSAT